MPIEVFSVFSVRDGQLVEEGPLPRRAGMGLGDVVAILTNFNNDGDGTGPEWEVEIEIGEGENARCINLTLPRFFTPEEYQQSYAEPVSFGRLRAQPSSESPHGRKPNRLWFYRDALYVTNRLPGPSEMDEVVLRIKVLHYQREEYLRRLREQVANFEAIEGLQAGINTRRAIPDDVKLLVWSRDNRTCVRCGSPNELHFDHVIPLCRGGSDEAANIQLLCRTCNLAKGGRLV